MKVLFLCLGNICRSPAGEAILKQKLQDRGLETSWLVDSAGTADYHLGEWPDGRMQKALRSRGYQGWSRARQLQAEDFHRFDLILAMDKSNLSHGLRLCPDPKLAAKIRLAAEGLAPAYAEEVADPYYGEEADFLQVIEHIEALCTKLLLSAKT